MPEEETPETVEEPETDTSETTAPATKQSQSVETKQTQEEDFTVRAMSFEIFRKILEQTQSDLKKIFEIIAPVVQPMLKAGDKAWKRLRKAVMKAWKTYELSRQSTETAETCEEAV